MYIKTIDEMQTNNIPVLVFVLQVIFTVDGLPFVLGLGWALAVLCLTTVCKAPNLMNFLTAAVKS